MASFRSRPLLPIVGVSLGGPFGGVRSRLEAANRLVAAIRPLTAWQPPSRRCRAAYTFLPPAPFKTRASKVAGADARREASQAADAVVVAGGDRVERAVSETHDLGGGRTVHARAARRAAADLRAQHRERLAEIARLVELGTRAAASFAAAQGAGGGIVQAHAMRSALVLGPLLWPHAYANRRDAFADKPELLEEPELAGNITERVAALLTAAGLETASSNIEPLQLVRYKAASSSGRTRPRRHRRVAGAGERDDRAGLRLDARPRTAERPTSRTSASRSRCARATPSRG